MRQGGIAPLRQWYREQRGEQRYDLRQGLARGIKQPLQLDEPGLGSLVALPAQQALEVRNHWVEGTVGMIGRTAKRQARTSLMPDVLPQRLHQSRFANTCLATEQHHLAQPFLTLLPAP